MIGFDDIDLAEIVGLTTIRQPLREGGALAADLLLAAIERGDRPAGRGAAGADGRRAPHDVIDAVLSAEGWPYASAPPVEPGDPGRFHALFGRDALITALQLLPARPEIARATLHALAARQGVREDPRHAGGAGQDRARVPRRAARAVRARGLAGGGQFRYYGTADATRVVPGRAGGRGERGLEEARRARPRAGSRTLDAGGGLVRHSPGAFAGGLAQQGWRDTIDAAADADGGGYVRADGTNPAPPLADADTQAVAVAALRALAADRRSGVRPARALAGAAHRAFGPEVMALEAGDVPVPGRGLAARLAAVGGRARARGGAAAAAERLCEPDILTRVRAAHARRDAIPSFAPATTTAAPSGRSTRGWAGAACARAGARERPRRVRTGVLAALDAPRARARAVRASTASWRRSRSPTASRRGRSAPAGRSSTTGTGVSALARDLGRSRDAPARSGASGGHPRSYWAERHPGRVRRQRWHFRDGDRRRGRSPSDGITHLLEHARARAQSAAREHPWNGSRRRARSVPKSMPARPSGERDEVRASSCAWCGRGAGASCRVDRARAASRRSCASAPRRDRARIRGRRARTLGTAGRADARRRGIALAHKAASRRLPLARRDWP